AGGTQTLVLSGNVGSLDVNEGSTGAATIFDGSNSNDGTTITLSGGNDTVVASSSEQLDQIGNGTLSFSGVGGDSITLGGGNDTISDAGSATILGGGGNNQITLGGTQASIGAAGNNDITLTHSASVTLSGGGNDTVNAVKGTALEQLGS